MKKIKTVNSLPKAEFKKSEFQEMLDVYMTETTEDLDSYSLQLPVHGSFWDDGYSDAKLVGREIKFLQSLDTGNGEIILRFGDGL